MKRIVKHCLLGAFVLLPMSSVAQIRLNQVGMYPAQEKTAAIEGVVGAGEISIVNIATGVQVSPKVLRFAVSPWSGKQRTIVDFSSVTAPGNYTLMCGA